MLRKFGPEALKYVQLGAQRLCLVKGIAVFALPPEGLAFGAFEAVEANAPHPEKIQVFFREVLAHHGH